MTLTRVNSLPEVRGHEEALLGGRSKASRLLHPADSRVDGFPLPPADSRCSDGERKPTAAARLETQDGVFPSSVTENTESLY